MEQITEERVNTFLNGHDPMEHIITIECDYADDQVSIVYVNDKGQKRIRLDNFKPFLWAKHSAAVRMFEGDKEKLRNKLRSYGIGIKKLITTMDGTTQERLENGYKYMFYATRKMSYQRFLMFFNESGVPLYERKKKGEEMPSSTKEYIAVSPVEQYMIETGRRLFKGYDNYDDLLRFTFDLETQGLNPRIHRIEQIGMHTNKGFDKVIAIEGNNKEELDASELKGIDEFLHTLAKIKPDTVVGHNSENFDWDFLIVRCEQLGTSFEDMSLKYFRHPIFKRKREASLKLGGEVEKYRPTVMWGHIILDSLHAARRAQAIDSNMKSSNLKYVTKYMDLKKSNRVYVPGEKITKTWNDLSDSYAFNDENGDWYKISDEKPLQDGYIKANGRYIVERYLLDDLWETDKVEEKLNESNFLVGKLLPTTFSRACTMGTASIWKLIMLAWCYENNLAAPSLIERRRFTGGLSRLLKTGYVDRIVKLDYNSLYPSIILTWNIKTPIDITNIMLHLLDYILTQREKYKGLKGEAGAKADAISVQLDNFNGTDAERHKLEREEQFWKAEKTANDKKQLPLKILANSYFGSAASTVFPFADSFSAERTTCTGRQCLRLMISHFTKLGYTPIVGDSFSGDTPLFIKYDDTNYIDIKPIEELIGETQTDALGREYDYSDKPYKVLCRSGWMHPKYIYRHKTNKPLYTIEDGNMNITVTEDHSLFNEKQEKIKPSEITKDTALEYYTKPIEVEHENRWLNERRAKWCAKIIVNGYENRVPRALLNTNNVDYIRIFLDGVKDIDHSKMSKTYQAGISFLNQKLISLNGKI